MRQVRWSCSFAKTETTTLELHTCHPPSPQHPPQEPTGASPISFSPPLFYDTPSRRRPPPHLLHEPARHLRDIDIPTLFRLYGFGALPPSLTPRARRAVTDLSQQAPNQPRPYPGQYLPNGGAPSGPVPGAVPLLPNQGRVIQQGSIRVLCIADVRGAHKSSGACRPPRLTPSRQSSVPQPASRRRTSKLHHPHRRLRLLRRPFTRAHC